jgi:hypothetical protein
LCRLEAVYDKRCARCIGIDDERVKVKKLGMALSMWSACNSKVKTFEK